MYRQILLPLCRFSVYVSNCPRKPGNNNYREIVKIEKTAYIVAAGVAACLLYSCATIGSPSGGAIDKDPPIFVGSNPAPNTLNFKGNKVELNFDEVVTLVDQSEKVMYSPVPRETPRLTVLGRKVLVEFRDTMKPGTTYSIDFANCIQDNNENNPIENFAFAFSTGDTIDTLQVSGMVLRARDLEPMQQVLVGIHSNLEDSAFTKLQFDRVARTNDRGQFTIRNLKPGRYRIYALDDVDRDYKFVRTEDMAFLLDTIIPGAYSEATMDTVFTKSLVVDTVVEGVHTVFTPNDILLSMSNEGYVSQYLHTYERPDYNRIYIKFSAHSDTLPGISIIEPVVRTDNDWYVLQKSEYNDSLFYWITDTALAHCDSIRISLNYLRTDTTEQLSYTTDSLYVNVKNAYKRQLEKSRKDEAKRLEALTKEYDNKMERLRKRAEERKDERDTVKAEMDARADSLEYANIRRTWVKDSLARIPYYDFKLVSGGTVEVDAALEFEVNEPVDSIVMAGFHLWKQYEDILWEEVVVPDLVLKEPFEIMKWSMPVKWEPGATYKVRVDSMSVYGIYGLPNKTIEQEFRVKGLEEYANLYLNVSPVSGPAFVELLNTGDAVQRTATVESDGYAVFNNVLPGEYYARIVLDSNGNGEWDTGNFAEHRQPEEVYYYPKKISLKENWDIEQSWNIYEVPVDMQKPEAIKKNKPEKKKWEENPNYGMPSDEEDDIYDEGPAIYTGNKYTDYQQLNR